MADLKMIQFAVTQNVPFNRLLGVEVISAEDEKVEVRLPAKPEHLNHVGTVHAAAQYALGEAASGAMAVNAFLSEIQSGKVVPLATKATANYRSPAQGDLLGVSSLAQAEQERSREELDQKGKTRFVVKVEIITGEEKVASEMEFEWILLRQKE
jgi:thioesterase domain-containing protein